MPQPLPENPPRTSAPAPRSWVGWLAAEAPLALLAVPLAYWTIRSILAATEGALSAPLDDTFIHFQFARRWAEGAPLVYADQAVAGATSLLWPLLLAPFWLVGFREEALVIPAWGLGLLAWALLAEETRRLSRGFVSEQVALATGALVLACGGLLWAAGSGMEVVPFSWALVRTVRRASEWVEADAGEPGRAGASSPRAATTVGAEAPAAREDAPGDDATSDETSDAPHRRPPALGELWALAAICPLLRPEGILGTVIVAGALLLRGAVRRASDEPARHLGARLRRAVSAGRLAPAGVALATAGLGPLAQWALTGSAASTTLAAKSWLLSPYPDEAWATMRWNAETLLHTLLDGKIWAAGFIPEHGKWLALLGLAAVLLVGHGERRWFRALAVVALALGVVPLITYETFLVNRLRYLWPFAPGWFVGLGALAHLVGRAVAELDARLRGADGLLAGALVGAFAVQLPGAVRDLATSTDAIRRQQVALGRWARELPADAVIGVNDAGAIAYLSGRRTFDVVGLTTPGEAPHWVAGYGARFEHYEHLSPARRPTHWIVYPRWFAIDAALGDFLTARTVPGATILGGPTMEAWTARGDAYGSAHTPTHPMARGRSVVDRLDVADLASEREHGYATNSGSRHQCMVWDDPVSGASDGGRSERTMERFRLQVLPGGALLVRVDVDGPRTAQVRVGGASLTLELPATVGRWDERILELPPALSGEAMVEVTYAGGVVDTLHWFSLGPSAGEP